VTRAAEQLVRRVWADLGRDTAELGALDGLPEVPLPARLDVSGLAAGAVAAASLAASCAVGGGDGVGGAGEAGGARRRAPRRVRLNGERIATAFTSERWFRRDGRAPDVWAPLSGFRRAADGWVRVHGNYPHHAAAARRGLGLSAEADVDAVDAAIARRTARDVEDMITSAGGVCAAVRGEDADQDLQLRNTPLIDLTGPASDAAPRARPNAGADRLARPLAGVRVLDLTRVIAGPVGTRALAGLGAEVLRIDSPHLAEPEWQHFDTGAGKRSALLDLRAPTDRRRFDELLERAHVIVLGYRPSALDALGLGADALAARRPGLMIGQLAAWGYDAHAAERRGFDSIVQAACGIGTAEGDGERPGALPAQALDHATGYLLATAVISMLEGGGRGGRIARLSLRRTAAELLGMPRTELPTPRRALSEDDAEAHVETFAVSGERVRVVAPALAYDGALDRWPAGPEGWGAAEPRWAE